MREVAAVNPVDAIVYAPTVRMLEHCSVACCSLIIMRVYTPVRDSGVFDTRVEASRVVNRGAIFSRG